MRTDPQPDSPPQEWRARVLDEHDETDREVLAGLRADPRIEFLDMSAAQRAEVNRLQATVDRGLPDEGPRWAYYPWRRTVVAVLGPQAFRAVRLDRNRNLITATEQRQLGQLRIGVAGLSVGHVIAHTLAAEGLCGAIRLADFDGLELSNLNRVPATVLDLGVNKAVVTARRIAELDPYLPVDVLTAGITTETVEDFLAGLDIVVEECDSLDMKAVVRERARTRRLPVLMATSDRGLIDVERFDTDPDRPILHGLLGHVDSQLLSTMSARDKIPHMLGHLDVPRASSRAAASMVEVGVTLTTWPQLAGDVVLGATAVAEAVRRIGLGEPLPSGRNRIDVSTALDELYDPYTGVAADDADSQAPELTDVTAVSDIQAIVDAALRAPSGGNAQPWRIDADRDSVTIEVEPKHTATVDLGYRSSAIAVGAALFNARVAAAARGVMGPAEFNTGDDATPLRATLHLADGDDPALAQRYPAVMRRESNRRHGDPGPLDTGTVEHLEAAARGEGARLRVLTTRESIDAAAEILAAADRVRYLTPRLHTEMVSELRWPGDPEPDTGLDIRSLELDASDVAVLEVLRRGDVMAHLADWDAGTLLGEDTRDRVRASSALGMLWVHGSTLADYARGGAAAESVWIAAEDRGLAVQPVSPLFLHAHDLEELNALSPHFAPMLSTLKDEFDGLVEGRADESAVLMLRFAHAPRASVRSRRDVTRVRSAVAPDHR